jgi:hypothetical protein
MNSVLKENRRGDRQLDSTVGGFSRKTGTGEACSAAAKRRLLGSEQQNRRQLEEDHDSGSRLEQAGNQFGNFSSQSKKSTRNGGASGENTRATRIEEDTRREQKTESHPAASNPNARRTKRQPAERCSERTKEAGDSRSRPLGRRRASPRIEDGRGTCGRGRTGTKTRTKMKSGEANPSVG